MHNVRLVFTRRDNEMRITPMYPIAVVDEQRASKVRFTYPDGATGTIDLDAKDWFIANSDDWRRVEGHLYEVRKMQFPDSVSGAMYCTRRHKLNNARSMGWTDELLETLTSDQVHRLLDLSSAEQWAAAELHSVNNFRSDFRESLHSTLMQWLNEESEYETPWTGKQLKCLTRYAPRYKF